MPEDAAALRPFWSGTITFGLVTVPVALYPAHRRAGVSLRMLSPDGRPLRRVYWCPADERVLDSDEIVRGYEVEPGRFVTVDDEELAALAPEKSRDIDLRRFVPRDELDPRYFDRAYFLTPDGDSNKAYRLLAAAMEAEDRAGIATFVMRGKEYLVAILAEDGILRAETLRFPAELRSAEELGLPEPAKPKPARVKEMAKAVAELAADELDRDELEDDRTRRVRSLAEKKRKAGREVVEVPEEAGEGGEAAAAPDLMNVLKWSLRQAEGGRGGGKKPAAKKPAARKPAVQKSDGAGEELAAKSRDELYRRAQELDLPGRSGMTKAELVRALRKSA